MKKVMAVVAAGAVSAAVAVPAFAATRTVTVKDNVFAPKTMTVSKGTTVRWVWKGNAPHNVKVTRGPVKFQSPVKTSGSFKRRMTRSGTYTIVCTIHAPTMRMTLKVR